MSGEVTVGICVIVVLIVTAIIGIVWIYRKHSNVEPEGKIHLKRKRPSESYDYILLEKNAIDQITIERNLHDYRPLKQLKTSKDKYNTYRFTDKHVYSETQNKEIPVSVLKHYSKSKVKPSHDYLYKSEYLYEPKSKRSSGDQEYKTVEAGDSNRTSKHTYRDGKYKHVRETRSGSRKKSSCEDIEESSHFTVPIKKHLSKIRPVRRPSLYSKKQLDSFDEYESSFNTGLLQNDNNITSDKHAETEADKTTTGRSVKEIVDDVKNEANSTLEKTVKTVILTNENFGRVNALKEKYDKKFDNQEPALHNLNRSGKDRRNQGIDVKMVSQNKSDISTEHDRGKKKDRLLRRNTMSDLCDENTKNGEKYQHQESRVRGDRCLQSSVQNELNSYKGGFRISNKVETSEKGTNGASIVCYPRNSEIKPKATNNISSFSSLKQLPFSQSTIANGEKTNDFTVSKAPVLQVDFLNGIKGEVSNLTKTASVDNTCRKLQNNPTLPSISNSPSFKLQQPKLQISSQTCDQVILSIDTSFDKSPTLKLSSPLLVSPVKPRPPVAPKPKTSRRMNTSTRNHLSDSKQNENSIDYHNVLKTEHNPKRSRELITAISPVIETMQPKCLPPIQKSSVHQVVGASNIPTISGASLRFQTVTTGAESQDTDYGESNLHAEEGKSIQINVVDQNDDSSTRNTRHVNFRSPLVCDIVLRTPSPDEPSLVSPVDSMMDQCETEGVEQENDFTDSHATDTQQPKLQVLNSHVNSEVKDASLDKEEVQNYLNQADQINNPISDNFEKSENLPNKVHVGDENVIQSPQVTFDSKDALRLLRGEIERTEIEPSLEVNNDPYPLTDESHYQIADIYSHQNSSTRNTSEVVLKAIGSNLESEGNQTSDNNDDTEAIQENDDPTLEETTEETVYRVPSNNSQGLSDTHIEGFNPNSSSTPLQSQTDIETNFKNGVDLDEGEATFAMVQEALAKRRKRFVNESIVSPRQELQDQSSMMHDDTCIRTDELSNDETNNNDTLCYLKDNRNPSSEHIDLV